MRASKQICFDVMNRRYPFSPEVFQETVSDTLSLVDTGFRGLQDWEGFLRSLLAVGNARIGAFEA